MIETRCLNRCRRTLRRSAGAVLGAVVGTVAASGSLAAPVEITHMTYFWHGQAWHDYLKDRAEAFNKRNPDIRVNILVAGETEAYGTKFTVMLAGGTPPDTTDFHPGIAAPFIGQGAFLDLRTYLRKDPSVRQSDFSPVVWKALTAADGSIWGLPADIYPVVTWFNADLLAEAGLPSPNDLAPADWTWARVVEMAKKLTRTDSQGNPAQFGIDRATGRYYIPVAQAGGALYDRHVQPTSSRWNTPAVVAGIEWVRSLLLEHRVAPPVTVNARDFYFWTGKTALDLVDGPGIIGAYLSKVQFAWDVAPQPLGPVNRASEVAVGAFEIVAASKHPDAAWEWLKFIAADPESTRRFVQVTGRVPSLRALQRQYPSLVAQAPRHWMVFFDTAADSDTFAGYVIPQANDVNPIVNRELVKVWRGEESVRNAVEAIHRQVEPILKAASGR